MTTVTITPPAARSDLLDIWAYIREGHIRQPNDRSPDLIAMKPHSKQSVTVP
jgi:hypothetical protein